MVDAGEGTGSIGGTVKDLAGSPVEQATVTLEQAVADGSNKTKSLETGLDGSFQFRGLAAGTYVLAVAKDGYLPPPGQPVHVVDHAEHELTIFLEWLPAPKPPSTHTDDYAVKMGSRACPVILNATSNCVQNGQSETLSIQVDVNENESGLLQTLLVEVSWPAQPSPCEGKIAFDLYAPQYSAYLLPGDGRTPGRDPPKQPTGPGGNPEAFHWASDRDAGESPVRLAIPRLGADAVAMHSAERIQANNGTPIQTSGVWTVRFQALDGADNPHAGVSCRIDQTLSIHATRFFGDPMPTPDWTAPASSPSHL